MQLILTLLATLLSTTLAYYVFQHEVTKNYLFIDVPDNDATTAKAFVAPLEVIQMRKSHLMNFDLTPVGDTFTITEVETGMALCDTPDEQFALRSEHLTAQKMDAPDDRGKWYLKPSDSEPGYVSNKFTTKFLYAYRVGTMGLAYPKVLTKKNSGNDMFGGSSWFVREVGGPAKNETGEEGEAASLGEDGGDPAAEKEDSADPKEESADPKEESADPKEESADPKEDSEVPKEDSAVPKEDPAVSKEEPADPKKDSEDPKKDSENPKEEPALP